MPEPSQSLFNNLVSFTVSSAMDGVYSANVNLTNENQQYGASDVFDVFRLVFAAITTSNLDDDSCLTGEGTVIYGVVQSVEDARHISEDVITYKVKSFFAGLGKKPINTEKYDTVATTVLGELADIYGGIPSALYDFTGMTDLTVKGVISGNNLLEEMKRVAEASQSTLYVSKEGLLVANPWKDNNSSVDHVVPKEAVIEAKINRSTAVGPSRVVIRGRFISQYDCGSQFLSSSDFENPFTPQPFRPAEDQGRIKVCGNEGVGKGKTKLRLGNLKGSFEDKKNAIISIIGDGELNFTEKFGGVFDVISTIGPSGTQISQGTHDYQIEVTSQVKPSNESTGANSRQGPLNRNVAAPGTKIGRMPGNLTGLPIADIGDLLQGTSGGGGSFDSDKTSDERETLRMEMWIGDSDLITEFGVVTEQIDNLYVNDFETLFDIAVRRFQRFKMKRNTWQVTTAYMPCIDLNDVITFTTPDNITTVTGVVTAIKLAYTPSPPSMSMQLIVEAFTDIGSTSYTSANLFVYPELCGTNGINWTATTPSDSFVRMMGGYVTMGNLTAGVPTIAQTFNLEIGASYSLVYNLVKDTGASITVEVLDSGTHATKTSTVTANDVTLNFTPNEIVNTVKWSATGNWFMARPRLFKTVTK